MKKICHHPRSTKRGRKTIKSRMSIQVGQVYNDTFVYPTKEEIQRIIHEAHQKNHDPANLVWMEIHK